MYGDVYSTTATGMTVGLTNNLVERSELSFYQENISGYDPLALSLYINGRLDSSGTRTIAAPTTTDPVTFGYGGFSP